MASAGARWATAALMIRRLASAGTQCSAPARIGTSKNPAPTKTSAANRWMTSSRE